MQDEDHFMLLCMAEPTIDFVAVMAVRKKRERDGGGGIMDVRQAL